MNCLILVLLLLCGCNNGSCNCSGWNGSRPGDRCGCGTEPDRRDRDCGCGNDRGRQDDDNCGCRNEFRSEPRFEQRPFTFNAGSVCGCEEPQGNSCDK